MKKSLLFEALTHFRSAQEEFTSCGRILNELIADLDADDDYRAYRRSQFQIVSSHKNIGFLMEDPTRKGIQKYTLSEINAMLIELNIKFKAHERANGLFEIRPTIGGKKVSIYGRTAEEIAKKYKDVIKKRKRGDFVPTAKIKLYAWLEEWLAVYKKPNVKQRTFENLTRCIKNQIKPNLEDKAINRYTLSELTAALNAIESTRMRKYARGTLREAFACAVTAGHLTISPAEHIQPVKHVTQKRKAIALLDLHDMLQRGANNLRRDLFLYYLFTLFAGTRRDEGLNLRGVHVDWKNKIIHIPGTKSETSKRLIPMFPILEKILSTIGATGQERFFNFKTYMADRFFSVLRGEQEELVLHCLRHTFGTVEICIHRIPINTVSLWLGHADTSITMDIYTHPEDLAPDIYYSGQYSEDEKLAILQDRYNKIISLVESFL